MADTRWPRRLRLWAASVILRQNSDDTREFSRLASLAERPMDTHALQVWEVGVGDHEGRGSINQRSMVARALRIAAVWDGEHRIAKIASELMTFKTTGFQMGSDDPAIHARVEKLLWRELAEAAKAHMELRR